MSSPEDEDEELQHLQNHQISVVNATKAFFRDSLFPRSSKLASVRQSRYNGVEVRKSEA
jgi:hypothetical protein